MYRLFEVTFYGAFAPIIIFAKSRQEIRRKYTDIDKIYHIEIN